MQRAVSRIGYQMVDYENDRIYSTVREVEFVAGVSKGLVFEDDVEEHLQKIKEYKVIQQQTKQQQYKGPKLS